MILKCFLGLIFFSYAIIFAHGGLSVAKECVLGPTHWCKNIENAKNCRAVKHCIQTVWEHQKVPEDKGDICSLCKNMVQDARDQLESNETREMIKEVFQGSCALLRYKPAVKYCDKFADELAPELVDMLSSQMNPDVICTVAGLCNSDKFSKITVFEDVKKEKMEERTKELQKNCEPCLDFADVIDRKIERATSDDIKSYLRERCRSLGSLSDSCSNLVDEYGDEIYKKMKKDFTPYSLCYLTASCVNGYHRKIQVKTESDVGVIHVNSDAVSVAVKHLSEDQTCALCKQLVKHFKEILTANTTEIEFKQVLKGLCEQTGKFRGECLALTDEYYEELYKFIVNDLDGKEVCTFAGICAKPGVYVNGPVAPFLPPAPVPIEDSKRNYGRVSLAKSGSNVHVFTPAISPVKVEISFGDPLESKFQLPIERMAVVPQPKDLNVNNREVCIFCQYFLHYIQKMISQPYGEKELKETMGKVCGLMPESMVLQCKNFVEQYGDAFIAILAEEIDPSQVCPSLHLCPAKVLGNKYEELEIGGSPGCPLCLMAIEDIKEKLNDNKTEETIRNALHNLCVRMPTSLKSQCDEFVKKYTEEMVDMILADFTPQEVCTYLKLCKPHPDVELVVHLPEGKEVNEKEEVMTNEVPRDDHVEIQKKTPPLCFLCEFIMDKINANLKNNSTEEDVKRVVMNVCRRMPKSIRSDCRDFVNNYSDYIVQMIIDETDPRMVCLKMHMCRVQEEHSMMHDLRNVVEECAICEAMIGAVRALLEDDQFDRNLSVQAAQICNSIPYLRPYEIERCRSMIVSYGPSIINLLVELEVRPSLVCPRLGLCDSTEQMKVDILNSTDADSQTERIPQLVGGNRCVWGPSYWCKNEENAKECGTLAHCREIVWKANKPTPAA